MMKTKRIILYLCVIVLAAFSVFCTEKAVELQQNLPDDIDELKTTYREEYNLDMMGVLSYANAEKLYLENYSNPKKVVVENKEFGNVTVKDLAEFFNRQQDEDENSEITLSGIQEELGARLEDVREWLTHSDENGNESARVEYKKEEQKLVRELEYYNQIENVYEPFADCVDELLVEKIESTAQPLKIEELQNDFQTERWGSSSGFFFDVRFKVGEKEYTLSNVEKGKTINPNYFDTVVTFKDGQINVQENDFDVYAWDNLVKKGTITSANFGICITDETKMLYEKVLEDYGKLEAEDAYTYAYCKDHIENAPSDSEIRKTKKESVIWICSLILAVVVSFVLFLILMLLAGHEKKGDQPRTKGIDRGWIDVGFLIAIILYTLVCLLVFEDAYGIIGAGVRFHDITMVCAYIIGVSGAVCLMLFGESFARRIKTKTLIDTTFLGKVWLLAKKVGKRLWKNTKQLMEDIGLLWKLIIVFAGGMLCNILLYPMVENFAASNHTIFGMVVIYGIFMLAICCVLWKYYSEKEQIVQGTKQISDGNLKYQIDEGMMFSSNRVLAKQVNCIGEGISKAVEESVKNERMKTELITNVSHDLKTPLTSIINYVDLLKDETVTEEQRKKYLDILSVKSLRLKNLTEDLVEASKLNSGVAKMEIGKLDLVQLVNQSLAEYEERFSARKLQVIKNVQEEPMLVMADGRKTWRLLDNLYNNVSKYAMPGTRVYVDLYTENGKAVVAVKNISENALNMDAEELMERFVRGETSRTTEGSGLGLSIAKSIAQRQNGDLEITLDGDLFKVTFEIDLCKE
ncbi:MAG: HAMP domain-containing histidine kinase [Eubacterium sp.]|nr:HAMP domain-containing histidine kinase [Eubacterium sp.]